jgi:hypothetical protein
MATNKKSITERRSDAFFQWASGKDSRKLASMLVCMLSNNDIKRICEDEGIKVN